MTSAQVRFLAEYIHDQADRLRAVVGSNDEQDRLALIAAAADALQGDARAVAILAENGVQVPGEPEK